MKEWIDIIIFDILHYLFLIYSGSLIILYTFLAIYSIIELKFYLKKNKNFDYKKLLASSFIPKISVLAPAFNEGPTIVENVRSLLSLNYPDFEIIIVNDGSSDDSMEKLIEAYQLESVERRFHQKMETKEIRGIYTSTNQAYDKLVVVDKENGGKADALNVGINISDAELVACIDVDCVLVQDALIKLVKPFLEHSEKRVIATGSVIRIINDCTVKSGKVTEVRLPKNLFARFQALEYMRSFLLARMAWSKLNGLLLISGAIGLFDKRVMIDAGGYRTDTVGEDMELIVRMRRQLEEQDVKYQVVYIPDPLCWTEVPESIGALGRQRNRWARGTAETLWAHRKLFYNPKYGILGMFSVPFWFFYEWMAPIVEFAGLLYFRLLAVHHQVNWNYFFTLLIAVYLFAIAFSTVAIIGEEITFRQYKRKSDIFKLFITSLIEPFIYHPFITLSSIKGNLTLLFSSKKNKSWGAMTRKGFSKQT